ncbi:MAG: AMP-binding protein, partial [Gammaproteobacteria bacterium]|nr:AMP-binding protein [Gammaproteobacteria bacterium]
MEMKKERDDFSLNRGIYDGNTGQFISYAELNIQIARLIDYLRKEHPKANRIALFMNQSADYSLCFMALYEAGLVPMPLSPDADNSPERLAGFLQGAGIDLILTTGMYHQHPFWGTEAARQFPVCTLDEITLKLANYSDTLTKTAAVNSSELGYIVNTSGSSGKPKQVLVSRGGLPFCIRGHIEALNITSEDKIAAFADVAFDAHIIEMYMAKDSGANLFIVPADCRRDLTKLAKFYQTHKITVGVFVASMLRKCEPNDFPALRVVICTGEKIDNNIIHKWRHRLLVDGYGPAENTIATWLKLIQLKETQQVVKMVMIPETSCHILKVDSTTPAEQGEEGELCIAGPGVALGYTDLELTQERFITLPEGRLRLYRTRDLACLNNDGTIDIVGRLDRQVKIYGKLVCPEEIEEAIKNSEPKKIAAVYVDAKVNDQGHPDFVAYIELRQGEEALDLAFLYEKISTYLGQTFIPTRWVFVEKLPQSPSQKTTIQGLNLSELTVLRLRGSSGQLPKAGLEEELARLFLEILAIEAGFELFRDDNFFELGGKSLQATVMIQILRSNYRLRLSYEQFVHSATPEQLARAIRRLQAKTEKKEIIELYLERETPANAPVFLIHSLLGDAERDYERLKSSWNNPRSLYAVNARGLNDSNDMDNNLLAIGYDYYLAIKNRYPRGPKIIAGWSLGGILALLVKHFFDRDQDQSVEVVMIDSESPTLFKDMSCNAYAHYLHDLFEKKLMGQTSLKTLPLSIETLSHLPKEQQIYRLFSEVLTALRDSASATEENKRLLVLIQNLLLGVLKLRWDNKMTESHLIAATATQESRGKRLGWPDSVKMKSLSVISGDHDSIVLAPLNAKAIAEHLEKISADFQAHFMVRVFSEDLRSRSIADINNEDLRYYIPAKGCQTTRYENNFNLLEMIRDDYLGSDQKVFLLLGNAGSGKTTFVQFLAKYLKERLSNTITLYIPLACYENPARGLIEAHLKKMELTDSQIAHLKKHQKFVFIIDGYDETDKGQYQNLYATNRFDQWNAKVIIACRSSYLYNVQNYRLIFYPVKNGKPLYSGLNEINLVPFDDTQIKEYIQSFLMHPPEEIEIEEGWQDAQTHIDHIDQLPGLRELIRTPFLLRVLMEVLPQIVEEYKEKPQIEAIPLTQSKILDAFIDNLWGRQAVK